MALKFRLRGLAETFIDSVTCPGCGRVGSDDDDFATEETRVTFNGIVVVVTCPSCSEVFVPKSQRLGIVNLNALREAVIQDSYDTGEPILHDLRAVEELVEKSNADRKGDIH
ncbi:MAG: hypothetical protein KDD70_11120 [Bdellovibrionales bacterium]|nr:hypothetical protein [Bdellovibrionales bacterium]